MSHSDPDLIAGLLAGELSEDSPEVQAALEASPELRAELDDLRGLEAGLARDGERVREALGRPRAVGESAGDVPSEGGSSNFGRSRRRWISVLLTAAAAVLLFYFLPGSDQEHERVPGQGQMLGSGDLVFEELAPQGPNSSFQEFRVVADLPAGARIEITIWDGEAPEDAKPLLLQRTTQFEASPSGFTWKPTPEQLNSLTRALRWDVRVSSVSGELLGVASDLKATR